MKDFKSLEKAIGYRFKDQSLLTQALTHRSYHGRINNERLEFLGDSILNFIIGEALFMRFPKAKEGQLSRLRANMVKGTTLADVGNQFELSRYLLVGPGELKCGGAQRGSTVADAVEAIIGAIYLEAGFAACQQVVQQWFTGRFDKLSLTDSVKDNKTRLQECLQSVRRALPTYRIIDIEGKSHNQIFRVECDIDGCEEVFIGEGTSRRHAEQQAAGKAINTLFGD